MKAKTPRKVISSFSDVPVEHKLIEVEVPEWGTVDDNSGELVPAVVLMRHISQGERRRFASRGELGVVMTMTDAEREIEIARWKDWYDSGKREAEILKMCYVKEDGSQLFTAEEVHRLLEQVDNKSVVRLLDRASKENLLTAESTDDFRKNG